MSQYPNQQPQEGYGQSQAPQYDNYETTSPPGVTPGPPPGPAAGRKKRRDYAGQAYEFGQGGNAAATPPGQQATPQTGPSFSGFSLQQEAAGYPQGAGYQQNPAAVQPGQTPMYGNQDGAGMGGYQPPGPQYPTQPAQAGVPAVTQQFSQMDMSQKHPQAQQPQAQQPGRPPVLNQLYPTDLQNQPLNVAELDYPPPPAILPANVSSFVWLLCDLLTNPDQRHSFSVRKLSTQVCAIDIECCADHTFSPQEIEVAIRAYHSALHVSTR